MPVMTPTFIKTVTKRYIELFEQITGQEFVKRNYDNMKENIEQSVNSFITNN